MYENITDDITTATTKLVIMPTPIVKNDAASNDSVTASNMDLTEQNNPLTMNHEPTVITPQEKSSRKKESVSSEDRRR